MLQRYTPTTDWIDHAHWLCHQLALTDGRLHTLSKDEIDQFGLDLSSGAFLHEHQSLAARTPIWATADAWLMRLGLQHPKWNATPCHRSLPMVGIHPKLGLCLVVKAATRQESWALLTPGGTRALLSQDTGWLFCSVALGWQVQLKMGGLGLAARVIMRHRWPFLSLLASTLVVNFGLLAVAWWLSHEFAQPILGLDGRSLMLLAMAVAISVGMTGLLDAIRRLINLRVAQNLDTDLAQEMFERLLNVRADPAGRRSDSLATQLQLFESVRLFTHTLVTMLVLDIPIALAFWWVIWWHGGAALATVPAVFVLIKLGQGAAILYRLKRWQDQRQNDQHNPMALMMEIVECAQTLNSPSLRSVFQRRWQDAIREQVAQNSKVEHLSQIALNESHGLRQIGFIVWLWVSLNIADQEALSLGTWVACSMLVTRVVHPVSALPALCLQWLQAKWALRHIDLICQRQMKDSEMPSSSRNGITQGQILLHDVSYGHQNRLDDLRIGHWLVKPGERVALVGDTGGGKSTLLKLVAGLHKAQRGQLLIDQLDVQRWPRHLLCDMVAYLPQSVQLFSGSLRDNLLAGMENVGDAKLMQVCQRVGLLSYVNAHPLGLDMPMQEGPHALSAGQRKLVGLARVLIRNPLIWLLDDPLGHLDGPLQERVMEVLKESIGPHQTLIVVGHQSALLSVVDRVTVLRAGRLIQDGPRDQAHRTR